jgi:hypothetical protein
MSEHVYEQIHNKPSSSDKVDLNSSDSCNNSAFHGNLNPQFESYTLDSHTFSIESSTVKNQSLQKAASKHLENDMNSQRLQKIGEEILERISKKRTNDELMHSDFRSELAEWTNHMSSKVMEIISEKYDDYSRQIALKFELISSDLERVEKIEKELKKIQAQVELLYQEISN